ncbi:MAG: type II secretion system inner membrane protein GspF [Candidatus Omnitrophica bacterium]|nr:type II secretion system inner membrane protein GspF [Candidatus Omnitrophota bacterium]
MEKFYYIAVDKDGKEVKADLEAGSLNDALSKIRQLGFFPVEVSPESKMLKSGNMAGVAFGKFNFFNLKNRRINPQELVIFTRQLAVLLDAGLPLTRCLHTLEKQARFETIKVIISEIVETIESGKSLSYALAQYPSSFSKVYVNIIKSGETGGALDQVLKRLADYLEQNLKITQRIKLALIYPCLVLIVSVAILGFIIAFVIPRFMALFQDTGISLPILTLCLLNVSNFLLKKWYIFFIIIVVLIICYRSLLRNNYLRYQHDRIILRVPIIGPFIQKIAAARFSRTLSTLLSGGVPILKALELSREVSSNEAVSRLITSVHDNVREGGFISRVLENSDIFPQLMINMVAVGEESGALDKMLSKVADTFEEEVELTANTLTSLLEPILVVIMGGIVGIIVLALFLPLIALIQSLTQ